MRGKRKLRIPPRPGKDWDEILAITLHQPRHDAQGNRIPVLSLEQVAALGPVETQMLKARGWQNRDLRGK